MTDLDKWLEEGERLEKAATKGPWEADEYGVTGPAGIGKPAVLAKNSAFIADARTRVGKQREIIRVMREALKGLVDPCTRQDYSVADLDQVVSRIASAALAEVERIAKGET